MKTILNKFLRKFNCEIHGLGYLAKLAKGEFKDDAFTKQAALLTGKRVKTIFDIGANRGGISRQYRSLFPDAKVFSFEAFPDTYQLLVDTTKADQAIIPYNMAVSNTVGQETMYVNQNVDTNSLLASASTGTVIDKQTATIKEITVKTTTIDAVCQQEGISFIDILKLDIQGGELKALEGAFDLLTEKRISIIYAEVSFMRQYEDSPLFHDIAKHLYSFGYQLGDLYEPYYTSQHIVQADAIFLSPHLIARN